MKGEGAPEQFSQLLHNTFTTVLPKLSQLCSARSHLEPPNSGQWDRKH